MITSREKTKIYPFLSLQCLIIFKLTSTKFLPKNFVVLISQLRMTVKGERPGY